MVGVTPSVKAVEVDYRCPEAGALPQVIVEIALVIGDGAWLGCARTGDLILGAVCAYLDGIVQALDDDACFICALSY